MYPWAVNFRELGVQGMIEMFIFMGTLLLGFIYVIKKKTAPNSAGVSYVKTNGASTTAIEDQALVSWVSSLPLRQATVRQQMGITKEPNKDAEAYLAQAA